jgi:quinol monooxygenase YgiN
MTHVAVIAKIPAAPGKRDQLRDALQGLLDNAAGEPDTLFYILHEDKGDENVLWMYELYTDQAALDAHMKTEGFKTAAGPIVPFLGGAPVLTFTTPTGGKGLPA